MFIDLLHSERLWLLVAVPLVAVAVWRGRRRRRKDWAALEMRGKPPGDGAWGWLLALPLLIVALSQPRWGRISPERPPGQDVILLVDTSRSMGVEDASPDRLGLAVATAEGVVEAMGREPGNRVGVVAFAARGVVRCPLTEAIGAASDSLRDLRPGDITPGGTDLGAGLDAALDAFDPEEHDGGRTILVFSDGEDFAGSWKESLKGLIAAKVVVHAIVIGDPKTPGAVPLGRGKSPLIYRGKPAESIRSDVVLSEIATSTGGVLIPLGFSKGNSLGAFFRDRIGPATRRSREGREPPERVERYPIFVAGALLSGFLGSWKARRRRSWMLLALLLVLGASPASDSASEAVATGNAAYRSGDFRRALAAFERASTLDPRSAIPRFDAASALFRLGRPREAAATYQEARERADDGLKTKIDFALGNTSLALGDVEGAIRHYDDCLASKAPGAVYDAVRRDAAENRRFALLHRPRKPADPEGNSGREPPPRTKNPPGDASPKKKEAPKAGSAEPTPGSPGDSPPDPSPKAVESGSDSPRSRLDSALKDVRDARRRRLPDSPPTPSSEGDRKDW